MKDKSEYNWYILSVFSKNKDVIPLLKKQVKDFVLPSFLNENPIYDSSCFGEIILPNSIGAPKYIFISSNLDDENTFFLINELTKKVSGLRLLSKKKLTYKEVEKSSFSIKKNPQSSSDSFIPGDSVQIYKGPFKNLLGKIVKINMYKLYVSVKLFGDYQVVAILKTEALKKSLNDE